MIFYVCSNRLKRKCNLPIMKLKFENENFEQLFCTLQHSKWLLDFLHINGLCVMFITFFSIQLDNGLYVVDLCFP
jgi:hypothetical protein